MDDLDGDAVLRQAVDRIRQRYQARRIVLFGSRAWGGARDDSDYDLLVLVPDQPDIRRIEAEMAWDLGELPAAFDVIVRAEGWWKEWSDAPLSLERRIEREGRTLYAAA